MDTGDDDGVVGAGATVVVCEGVFEFGVVAEEESAEHGGEVTVASGDLFDAGEEPGAGFVDGSLDGVAAGVGDLDDGVAFGDAGAPVDFAVGEVAFCVEVAGVAGVVDGADAQGELQAVAVGPVWGGFFWFEVEADAEAGARGGGEGEEEAFGFSLGEGIDAAFERDDFARVCIDDGFGLVVGAGGAGDGEPEEDCVA